MIDNAKRTRVQHAAEELNAAARELALNTANQGVAVMVRRATVATNKAGESSLRLDVRLFVALKG